VPSRKRQVRIVRAFLAAPRDTSEEKEALARVVDSVNRVTGREEGFRIDLVHWSTDTHPAIGPDVQSVVNAQIGEYDLLVVVLNREFGSRTPRANSGTEEEYDRAYLRYLRDTHSVGILVYFADPLVRLHSIDPISLSQIYQFQRRLGKEGVLYAMYRDIPEFERIISSQLTNACREFLTNRGHSLKAKTAKPSAGESQRYPDWIAESRMVLPQSANYIDFDLAKYQHASLSFHGKFQSPSPYFRFGFKLSGLRQPVLGDGSVQTPDPNMVFHIGKNLGSDAIFYTIYRNGRRFGKDHLVLAGIKPSDAIAVGFTLSTDNVVGFCVNGEVAHEDRLPNEARERLCVLTWADEHQCQIEFTEISLDINRN
jgi:hypothetical protein